jgi:hypothetical protein
VLGSAPEGEGGNGAGERVWGAPQHRNSVMLACSSADSGGGIGRPGSALRAERRRAERGERGFYERGIVEMVEVREGAGRVGGCAGFLVKRGSSWRRRSQ